MSRIDIARAYPIGDGFVRWIVKECTNENIVLEGGQTFEFPFPTNGLRQKITPWSFIVIKVTSAGSAKEYYIIETPAVRQATTQEVATVLESAAT